MRSILQPVALLLATVLVIGSITSRVIGGQRAVNSYWKAIERYTGGQ